LRGIILLDASFIIMGILFGFFIAAMPGPIGIICIRRTLDSGRMAGLVSGLGTATADAIYCFIAGFGVTCVSVLLIEGRIWLQLLGGIFLVLLGIWTFFSRPCQKSVKSSGTGLFKIYSSMFLLTLSNPMTILLFAGITAGLGVGTPGNDFTPATSLVLGVFGGSVLWWVIMSTGISLFQSRLKEIHILWINRVIGIIICVAGVLSLISLILPE
jgi:threonine/homoserine/homoserine lactone efflux protein